MEGDTDIPDAGLSAKIVWSIATSETPLTAKEVGDSMEYDKGSIHDTMRRLFQNKYLFRRKRETDRPGPDPYEYRLTSRDEYEELNDE